MSFKENLDKMPDIAHLSGLDIIDNAGNVAHHIPAAEGKLGSLKLYYALAQEFGNTLNRYAAEQGLAWFAEIVDDAEAHPGKHPNIDLLLKVQDEDLVYTLKLLAK